MFWIVVVVGVALYAAFFFDRKHRNSRGGGDALGAHSAAVIEVQRHFGPDGGGGSSDYTG